MLHWADMFHELASAVTCHLRSFSLARLSNKIKSEAPVSTTRRNGWPSIIISTVTKGGSVLKETASEPGVVEPKLIRRAGGSISKARDARITKAIGSVM